MLTQRVQAYALAVIAAATLTTACGQAQSGRSTPAGQPAASNGATMATTPDESIDFTAPPPLIGIEKVSSPAAGSASLPFTIVAPTSLGTSTVYISNTYPEAGLVYKDSTLGTYWVIEHVSSMTEQDLKNLAACPSVAAGCGDPDWTLTALSDGTPAIEIGTPPDTSVLFLHNGLRFDVIGPPGTFTEQDAMGVANELEAAA